MSVRIDVEFNITEDINLLFDEDDQSFIVELDATYGSKDVDYYTGSYEVTPKVTPQTLDTQYKFMSENVNIKGVPTFETSNEYGNTFYIASEV